MAYTLTFSAYQQALAEGNFLGLHCVDCNAWTVPPLGVCRSCGSTHLRSETLSGEGILRTFTVIRVPPEGREAPYLVAMVELKEGPWVMGNLLDVDPDEAALALVGKSVRLGSQTIAADAYTHEDSQALTFHLT
jgi:uncharacterized protein